MNGQVVSTQSYSERASACHDSYEPPVPADRWVVVGVDGSAGSVAALRLAAEEAAERHARLRAVTAGGGEESARLQRETLAAAFGATGPPAGTELVVATGRPSDVLIAAARDAELVVVGANGRSAGTRPILGSTAKACLEHCTHPVLVAPRA